MIELIITSVLALTVIVLAACGIARFVERDGW